MIGHGDDFADAKAAQMLPPEAFEQRMRGKREALGYLIADTAKAIKAVFAFLRRSLM